MSAFREAPADPAVRERFDAAWDGFAEVIAAGCDAKDELHLTDGVEAVAEAAYVPGGPSREALAAQYEELRAEALAAQQQRGTAA